MESSPSSALTSASSATQVATKRQIRGSSLLLIGRLVSMAINFAVQVLIVRYLSTQDYGAFAYALSFVVVGQTLATFGLDRAVTRFVPIYHEQRDYNKLFGTILMVVGAIIGLGLTLVLLVYGLQASIGQVLLRESSNARLTVTLLLILIGLAPVQALDDLIIALFAVFASPRAIFLRKYVLTPGLKLAVVLLLIAWQSSAVFLATGYLVSGIVGVGLYAFILARVLAGQGVLQHLNVQTLEIPVRSIFGFTVPMLTSDLVYVVMSSSDAVMLGYYHNTSEVAMFRVVQPAAILNQMVFSSFALLFTPIAARLFARHDYEGINSLYWQTAVWTSLLSFPIFVLTFSLAQPITGLLYGEQYLESAPILALLALGYYFNAALGFNGLTLKVFGRLRYIMGMNVVAAIANIGLNLLLIPRYGALGAAIGTCATLVGHNILKQLGLKSGTGIRLFEWRYVRIYLSIVLGTLVLLMLRILLVPSFYIGFLLAMVVSLAILWLNRTALNVGEFFPELLRIPFVGRLFG